MTTRAKQFGLFVSASNAVSMFLIAASYAISEKSEHDNTIAIIWLALSSFWVVVHVLIRLDVIKLE